jgi:diguanylate cyclase (GGDEF)-like protein
MKNKEQRTDETAQIYEREFRLVESTKKVQADGNIAPEELSKQYDYLAGEYEKLLKRMVKITRVGDSNQRRLLLANEQIERQKEELSIAYEKLDQVARTDPLTLLSNRRDFLEKFQYEINRFERHQKPFAIAIGDIDSFKEVNDRYGHDTGDFVLVNTASLIKTTIRKQDVVARWGGEEFILLLPGTPMKGGEIVAEEIRKRLQNKTYTYNDLRLSITITFGVSQYDGSSDIEDCIKRADIALYKGKRQGKNRVILADSTVNK